MFALFARATETEHRSTSEVRRQCLIAGALFFAALWLYTRHNDFPFYYHPDEPGKIAQIRDGTRNFNHPLLLLTATDLSRRLTGTTADCQQIVELGRWCSAIFAAAAVALFSWLGFDRFGVLGGCVAGVAMLVQRRIYEHAHFMKEDAALLAGIALTFVAIDAFWRRPTLLRCAALGAAAAVAASGKYIGIVMLPFAFAALIGRRDESLGGWKKWLGFVVAFVVVAAAINCRAIFAVAELAVGFGGEIARLDSRSGTDIEFGRFGWLERLLDIPVFLLLLFAFHLSRLRHLARPDVLLTAFPFVLGLILSFSSKQSGRHMLPALVLIAFVASMAAIRLAKELSARRVELGSAIVATFLLSALAYEAFATLRLDDGLRSDYRRDLVEWINANVPPEGALAVEHRVGVPYENSSRFCELRSPLRQQVRGARFAADLGSLDELRGAGVSHVATTDSQPEVFLKEEVSIAQQKDATFGRRREFYQRLLNEGRLVWSREAGNVGVLNPGLRLYEIAAPASASHP